MDKSKSQHYNFCYEALPALFHSQTDRFMEMLEKDGIKFLKFWWDYVAEQIPEDKKSSFEGMDFKIEKVGKATKMVVLTLPTPTKEGELYFAALIANPERNFAWLRLPNRRLVCLARRAKDDDFENGTELGDLTPRMIFVPIGPGPVPTLEEFSKIALEKAQQYSRK